MQYLLRQTDVNQIVVPIMYIMYISRQNEAYIGLLNLCTFILLRLSSEREFAIQLNQTCSVKLPIDLHHAHCTNADVLIMVFHKMIVNGIDRLSPLYDCLVTILANISPYVKSISMVASVKLLRLVSSCRQV